MLGYDTANPLEVEPEFISDVGTKTREKVDYAILGTDGKPCILIEAKPCTEALEKHDSQLFRYFAATQVKFALLTNGIIYRFYTDLQAENRMDPSPFLEFDILNLKESLIPNIKKFAKGNFNVDDLAETANRLQYTAKIMQKLDTELNNPTDELLKYFLKDIHDGLKTKQVLEKLRPVAIEAFAQYLNEKFSERLRPVIDNIKKEEVKATEAPSQLVEEEKPAIITTDEEIEAFHIVRAILRRKVDIKRISFRDTVGYFSIILDGSRNKWICRFVFGESKKRMLLNNSEENIYIESLDDIYSHEDIITAALETLL